MFNSSMKHSKNGGLGLHHFHRLVGHGHKHTNHNRTGGTHRRLGIDVPNQRWKPAPLPNDYVPNPVRIAKIKTITRLFGYALTIAVVCGMHSCVGALLTP